MKKFHGEVEGAAIRLEELLSQKKMKMIQAARVHALETETHEVHNKTVKRMKIRTRLFFTAFFDHFANENKKIINLNVIITVKNWTFFCPHNYGVDI